MKPVRRPFAGHKSRRYMLDFLFTGSESNVRHGRSRSQTAQTPLQASPRQQLSQHMPQPCVSKGVQGCRLPALKPLNRPAGPSKGTTFAATGPSHVFFTAFKAAQRKTDRDRQTDRDRHGRTETETETKPASPRQTRSQTHRQAHRQTHRETHRDKQTETDTQRQTHRQTHRQR